MNYTGIDACKSGWFYVLMNQTGWEMGVLSSIEAIQSIADSDSKILIDIPIGLREKGNLERLCDLEARRRLQQPRACSVFPAPARQTLSAENYDEANQINRHYTGRGLSQQTYAIVPKIREVDIFKQKNSDFTIREMHPEVCFWALNNFQPMKHNKKTKDGILERRKILNYYCKYSDEIFQTALKKYLRKEVARDDILDALVGTVTAMKYKQIKTLPDKPEIDPKGFPMEMVYASAS
jgi:predicted RNase H-like nuclease